jgi:hypothetical protein
VQVEISADPQLKIASFRQKACIAFYHLNHYNHLLSLSRAARLQQEERGRKVYVVTGDHIISLTARLVGTDRLKAFQIQL